MSQEKPLVFLEIFDLGCPSAREAFEQRLSDLAMSGLAAKKRFAAIASQFVAQHRWQRQLHEFDTEQQVKQLLLTLCGDLGSLDYCELGPVLRKELLHLIGTGHASGRA